MASGHEETEWGRRLRNADLMIWAIQQAARLKNVSIVVSNKYIKDFNSTKIDSNSIGYWIVWLNNIIIMQHMALRIGMVPDKLQRVNQVMLKKTFSCGINAREYYRLIENVFSFSANFDD